LCQLEKPLSSVLVSGGLLWFIAVDAQRNLAIDLCCPGKMGMQISLAEQVVLI
jgi:hypothetical protein